MPSENTENEIFQLALGLAKEERDSVVSQLCGDNTELLGHVNDRLQAREKTGTLGEQAGDRLGPYELIRELGTGGMGTVWLARQDEPVAREVALKVVKVGMDTRDVIARFNAERQTLALMNHSGIARIYDADATESGRPYFVMELVHGEPMVRYCNQRKLSLRDRLDLFMQVCDAIQHAHQKGIVHRDLKPSNILVVDGNVSEANAVPNPPGKPQIKVIDFGIAKAIVGSENQDVRYQTVEGQFIGTPLYMSPEQAGGSLDIDTRSDVYSLGVLLYQLITGRPPFALPELREAGYLEMLRVIREEEPAKPSTRLGTLDGKSQTTLSASHGTEITRLQRMVRGDLDWVVMKALSKERDRRYPTPTELARDIRHFLTDQPVSAAAPSRSYRLRKFVLRNRLLIAFGSTLAAVLLASTIISAYMAHLVGKERDQSRVSEAKAQRHLYSARMQVAQRELTEDRITGFRNALQFYENDTSELTSWEYHYLRGRTREYLKRRKIHEGAVTKLVAHPQDDSRFASGGEDGIVRVWNANGELEHEFQGQTGAIRGLAWSLDGNVLASSADDGIIVLWQLTETPNDPKVIRTSHDHINALCWTGEASLVSCASDGKLVQWDANTGNQVSTLGQFREPLLALAWEPRQNLLAVSTNVGGIFVIFPTTQQVISSWTSRSAEEIQSLAWSPNGIRLLSASAHNTVNVRNLQFNTDEFQEEIHQGAISAVGWFSNTRLVSAGSDELLRFTDLPSPRFEEMGRLFIREVPNERGLLHEGAVTAFTGLGRDHNHLFSGDAGGYLYHWNAWRGDDPSVLPKSVGLFAIDWFADGRHIAMSNSRTTWQIIDTESRKMVWEVPGHGDQIIHLAISPNDKLAATCSNDRTIRIWSLNGLQAPEESVRIEGLSVKQLIWSPDSRWVAAIVNEPKDSEAGLIALDPSNGNRLWELPGTYAEVAWNPKGTVIASLPSTGGLELLDPDTGTIIASGIGAKELAPSNGKSSGSISWSGDGKRLAFGRGLRLCVADMTDNSGKILVVTEPHTSSIRRVRWHPQENRIATGGSDASIKILDGNTGEEILALRDHTGEIYDLSWSNDGFKLASGAYDNDIRIWNAANSYRPPSTDDTTTIPTSMHAVQVEVPQPTPEETEAQTALDAFNLALRSNNIPQARQALEQVIGNAPIDFGEEPQQVRAALSQYFGLLFESARHSLRQPTTRQSLALIMLEAFVNASTRTVVAIEDTSLFESVASLRGPAANVPLHCPTMWRGQWANAVFSANLRAQPWTTIDFDDSKWGAWTKAYLKCVVCHSFLHDKQSIIHLRASLEVSGSFNGPVHARVKRDDGVVVYINGIEVFRDNVPADFTNLETIWANRPLRSPEQDTWIPFTFDGSILKPDERNVMAVELYQFDENSYDHDFDIRFMRDDGNLLSWIESEGFDNVMQEALALVPANLRDSWQSVLRFAFAKNPLANPSLDNDASAWTRRWRIQLALNEWKAALDAFQRESDLLKQGPQAIGAARDSQRFIVDEFLRKQADMVNPQAPSIFIPALNSPLPESIVDLSQHFNSGLYDERHWYGQERVHLASLAALANSLDSNLNLRGIVQLRDQDVTVAGKASRLSHYPKKAEIVVNRTVPGLTFLHSCVSNNYDFPADGPRKIALYTIHFADGSSEEIPLVYETHLLTVMRPKLNTASPLAEGSSLWPGLGWGLTKMHWENPHPSKEIASITFESLDQGLAALLLDIREAPRSPQ